ncbi:MAG: YceI family protein [Acidimicrobiales bacterium]
MSQPMAADGPARPNARIPAITSLVLGLLWLGGAGSVLAVVLGFVGMRRSQGQPGSTRGIAIAGLTLGVLGIVVPVLLVALGVVTLSGDDSAPKPIAIEAGAGSTPTGTAPASLDGTWKVVGDGASTAGLRIDESFVRGLKEHTAVGRSTAVTGSLEVAGTKVTDAKVTVDLSALEFTDDPGFPVMNRVNSMRRVGLETDRFPTATFELTEPIDFGERPAEGKVVDATSTGELTLHGVTKEVTVPIQAKLAGDTITVATNPEDPVEVSLADHGIDKPVLGPVANVADTGTFELLLVFEPS